MPALQESKAVKRPQTIYLVAALLFLGLAVSILLALRQGAFRLPRSGATHREGWPQLAQEPPSRPPVPQPRMETEPPPASQPSSPAPPADRPRPPASPARLQVEKHPLVLEAIASTSRFAPGARLDITLDLAIADGWHINSHKPLSRFLRPTSVEAGDGIPITIGEVRYPEGEEMTLSFSPDAMSVYTGNVSLTVPLAIAPEAKPGKAVVSLLLRYQACDDRKCLPPARLEVSLPVEIVAAGPAE